VLLSDPSISLMAFRFQSRQPEKYPTLADTSFPVPEFSDDELPDLPEMRDGVGMLTRRILECAWELLREEPGKFDRASYATLENLKRRRIELSILIARIKVSGTGGREVVLFDPDQYREMLNFAEETAKRISARKGWAVALVRDLMTESLCRQVAWVRLHTDLTIADNIPPDISDALRESAREEAGK